MCFVFLKVSGSIFTLLDIYGFEKLCERHSWQAQGSEEAIPVCFRYKITALESTHMFKPNAFESDTVPSHRTFGACYNGRYDKVVNNAFAKVLWEVLLAKKSQVDGSHCCDGSMYFMHRALCNIF